MNRRCQGGFTTTEYLTIGLVVVAIFLVPMPADVAPFNGRTLMATLIDLMKLMYANFAFGVGLPRLPVP